LSKISFALDVGGIIIENLRLMEIRIYENIVDADANGGIENSCGVGKFD
jgi:hypothetical protein